VLGSLSETTERSAHPTLDPIHPAHVLQEKNLPKGLIILSRAYQRLQGVAGDDTSCGVGADELVPVVTVCCHRYAVEDDQDRLTLDCCVRTDRDKQLSYGVLAYKSTQPDETTRGRLIGLRLRPLKLSKFLSATEV
jgi:hypothetical protein